jgi:hypothetical protein
VVGSASTVTVTHRAGTGLVRSRPQRGDDTGRVVAMAERVPWPAAPIAWSGPGGPPL